jgi:nitroimidazol reductase NimA-like FMN-containing flavoprotein (pyridoxamine 5'-phosphate oxidase superfamily)
MVVRGTSRAPKRHMSATLLPSVNSTNQVLSPEECAATLARTCFGHLAFARPERADVLPVRFAFVNGWLYFRADMPLHRAIATNPQVTLAVTERRDITRFCSVIVRGGCYETELTGAIGADTAAMRGIMQLRDPAGVPYPLVRRPARRVLKVLRLRVDEMSGTTTVVPQQDEEHDYDDVELQILRETVGHQTAREDARADDDGMAESLPLAPSAVTTPCR